MKKCNCDFCNYVRKMINWKEIKRASLMQKQKKVKRGKKL